jgi:hypothetical protein
VQWAFLVAQLSSVEGIFSLAFDQEPGWMGFVAGASHLAPGLAVFFVPEVTSATGRDVHLAATRGNGDRDDVPQIFRDDIGNDEVNFLGGICRRAFEFDDVAGTVRVP